jgi:hypothetical protein
MRAQALYELKSGFVVASLTVHPFLMRQCAVRELMPFARASAAMLTMGANSAPASMSLRTRGREHLSAFAAASMDSQRVPSASITGMGAGLMGAPS